MKKTRLLFVIVISLLYCNTTRAGDLQILHEGTESLCFKITDVTNRTLEVITNKEFSNTQYTGDIIIPDTVYLFYDWDAIPYRVTSVGKNAFSECGGITSVTIPSSMTNIGDYAFYNCDGITSIEIPNNVTSIGNFAFYDCEGLTDATIGNSVTSIGSQAFGYCSKLRTVINLSNLTFSKGSTNYGYIARYASKVINAPNGFIDSDYIWFENESGMTLAGYLGNATELTLPIEYNGKSVTNIGDYAFYSCTELTSVTIPNSVTSIGNYAFYGCSGITSIEIPNNVTSIGNFAFYDCEGLTDATIGNSVTSIGSQAFGYCSALKSVVNFSLLTFNKKSDDYGEVAYYANKVINAPNGEFIDDFVFYTSDNENFLAGYIGNATELVLPENYKGENYHIGEQAFNSYTGLTSVTIPYCVTGIGDYSFWGCSNLTNITSFIPAGKLFAIGEYTFCRVDSKNCTLCVPYKAKEKYASTDGWKYFKNIVELRDTYKVTFCIDGKEVVAYDIKEGDSIVYPNEYEKEGYSLIWDTNIDIMPSYNITINGTFTVNSYTITYIVDGEVYKTDSVTYGTDVVLIDEPTKEGHTFSGWSEAPTIMPAEDITISGTFTANDYAVTYIVDGEVYKTDSVTYGTEIVLIDEPTKEGHTFSGWSEAPTIMLAEDIVICGSFSVNSYVVTYIVDGEVYKTVSVVYGTEIVLIDEPTKEGHTFSGWSEAPTTMPAEDITISGSFTVNNYTVTYIVDGEVYKTDSVTYGTDVVLIDEPTKEGHTFSGWSEAPTTMPAEDITISGSFTVNNYTVTFTVDGEVYKTMMIEYGTEIPTIETPTKDGRKFSGWSEIPSTMPAKNVNVEGGFCYTIIYMLDGKYYNSSEVYYGSVIKTPAEPPHKEGHTFVEWGNLPNTMPARDMTVHAIYSVNKYQLIFIIDGEVYETLYIEYGSKIEYPQKDGYIIIWETENLPETMPAENLIIIGTSTLDTGVEYINEDYKEKSVYTIDGRKLENVNNLKHGIYIINGKKVLVK